MGKKKPSFKSPVKEKIEYLKRKVDDTYAGKETEEVEGGKKYDKGKLRWSLLPWKQLEEVVKVLEFGAKKYGINNWQKVETPRYKDALLRHVLAMIMGEVFDEESGFRHSTHAICCLLFIMFQQDRDGYTAAEIAEMGLAMKAEELHKDG